MLRRAVGALAVAGAATLAWSLVEAHAFTLRRVTVPVLPPGSDPIRILHLSDLHLTPGQRDKIAWVRALADEPVDLVVTTGDNLAHELAVAPLLGAYEPLMRHPGIFVFGSNDYFGPRPKNPFAYFGGPSLVHAEPQKLPVEDLRAGLAAGGWIDANNARAALTVNGVRIRVVGLDDPHIDRDEMPGGRRSSADLVLGIVHAPYQRALKALADDGAQLIVAGHTHGGQVCVPGLGALVTNCDLDTGRAKGLSTWPDASGPWLHVSAGLGTSPFAPVRLACRPEATVLTLVEA
jgi:predicted MPP superfamily phosphohydrolase